MEAMKLMISIVERGTGAAMLRLYRSRKVVLHFQCPGTGTATSEIMDILGLGSSEKDLVLSLATEEAAGRLLAELDSDLRGSTGTSGLVFTVPVTGISNLVATLVAHQSKLLKRGNGGIPPMERAENSLILAVCNLGCTDEVMDTAKQAGARGGTVVRGRSLAAEEAQKFLHITIQPEKDVVLILVPAAGRQPVMKAICAEGAGIGHALAFSLPVSDVTGLSLAPFGAAEQKEGEDEKQ